MSVENRMSGFYGWWLLFFLWIVYTIPIGFAFYSPAVLYPFMIHEMGWSRGEIMGGATALTLTFGLTSPFTALMISRFGARATIVAGGVFLAGASFLIGVLGHVYSAYIALSLAVGFGVSLASMIPVQTVAISWFHTRRALALGLVLGGGAVGGFIAPQIVNKVVQYAGGNWSIGWYMIALAAAVGALVALVAVRNRPGDLGQQPDGRVADVPDHEKALKSRETGTFRTTRIWTVREAVKTRALWLLMAAVIGSFFLWQVVVTQGPLHFRDRGFDATQAAFFYSLAIGLSVVGRFTIAVLGDRIEPRILFSAGALCILAGGVLFWSVSPDALWTAYLYPLLAGFGFGAAYVCIPTLIGNYWGPEAFAGISGLVSPIIILFQAVAAPLAGLLFDIQGTYFAIMLVAWVAAGVGFTAMFFCKPPRPPGKKGDS